MRMLLSGWLRRVPRVALALALAACGRDAPRVAGGAVDTTGLRARPVPAEFQPGKQLFDASCAACHGSAALGTTQGPPLVHIYYEPNHHGDDAFMMAIGTGVRQHHWNFGDMPAVSGLGPDEAEQIIAYVRWLQREAGVY